MLILTFGLCQAKSGLQAYAKCIDSDSYHACAVSFGHFALWGAEKGVCVCVGGGGGGGWGESYFWAVLASCRYFFESLLKLTLFGGLSKFLVFLGVF